MTSRTDFEPSYVPHIREHQHDWDNSHLDFGDTRSSHGMD
jgi:hypothetical protein